MQWAMKNVPLYFGLPCSLVDFYTCTNGNRNEYSTAEFQNLQLYRNCVPTPPDKTKTTYHIKRHILKSVVTVFYYSTARMSLWAKWAVVYKLCSLNSASLTLTARTSDRTFGYLNKKGQLRWQTRATLAKRLHGLRIASLPIDSLPMVSY